MNKKKIFGIVIICIVALAGAWYFLKGRKSTGEKLVDNVPTGVPGDDALYNEMKEKYKASYQSADDLSWLLPVIAEYASGARPLPADMLINGQPNKTGAFFTAWSSGIGAWTNGSPEANAGGKVLYKLKDGVAFQEVSDFLYWTHRNLKNSVEYAGL